MEEFKDSQSADGFMLRTLRKNIEYLVATHAASKEMTVLAKLKLEAMTSVIKWMC